MAGSNLRKFRNPEVLRKFSFQRLLEMVGRYKGYFDRMQFQIEGATFRKRYVDAPNDDDKQRKRPQKEDHGEYIEQHSQMDLIQNARLDTLAERI